MVPGPAPRSGAARRVLSVEREDDRWSSSSLSFSRGKKRDEAGINRRRAAKGGGGTGGAEREKTRQRMERPSPTDDRWSSRMAPRPPLRAPEFGEPPKMDQNRNVSSAAAETTVSPSGLCARWSTRAVWPVSSQSLVM